MILKGRENNGRMILKKRGRTNWEGDNKREGEQWEADSKSLYAMVYS